MPKTCKDCTADISHRHKLTKYCHECTERRHGESCRIAQNKRQGKDGQYVYPTQDRICNICDKPVKHYLKDARSCKLCRNAVLEMSDAMCEGVLGDPATSEHFDKWEKEKKENG